MANSLTGALSGIRDVQTRREIQALGLEFRKLKGDMSAFIRNNEEVVVSGVTAGSYTYASITVDEQGRVTAASSGAAPPAAANPTGTVGLSTVNGALTTYMRSDAAPALSQSIVPTWTGIHTFSAQDVHNAGVSLGTSGVVNASVANAAAAIGMLFQPTVALTSGTDRWTHVMKDSAGNTRFSIASNGAVSLFLENATAGGIVSVGGTTASTMSYGIFFAPTFATSSPAAAIIGLSSATCGGFFNPADGSSSTATDLVAGYFGNSSVQTGRAHTSVYGGIFQPVKSFTGTTASAHGDLFGWRVIQNALAKNTTATSAYGGYIENLCGATPNNVNAYGIYIAEQDSGSSINNGIFLANATSGRKCIAIRDQDAWIGSDAAATLTLGGTNLDLASTNFGWNVTPVAQPTTAIAASTFTANTSGIADDTATWDGYTVGQVVKALRNLGWLA